MKKNNAADCEIFYVRIDEKQHPIAFNAKVEELVNAGMERDRAKEFVRQTEFDMELYYDTDRGLFLVESEAVECSPIYSPYSGEELEECDDDE